MQPVRGPSERTCRPPVPCPPDTPALRTVLDAAGHRLPRSVRSRIEWVWLHWSEYLRARDEFYRWFQKMTVALEAPVELQVGLKEKQWQLSHAQVLLHNVGNQAVLLDRLLEEAGSLFCRIGDPSVDEEAQKRMKAEYGAVKAKAQVREVWRAPASPLRRSPLPFTHTAKHSLPACPPPPPWMSCTHCLRCGLPTPTHPLAPPPCSDQPLRPPRAPLPLAPPPSLRSE